MSAPSRKVDFATFFALHAEARRWEVPDVHWRAIHWLQHRGSLAVLRCFRGFGKSTILAVYNAWRYYDNCAYRILHQSESDGTAYKTSRDTQAVLRAHPLTQGMFRDGGVEQWWVDGANDPRNASMYAKGILSNVTSARADEAQNDDVEVPRNIQTPEAREKLRYRLGEQTFILVPGGRTLYVGTPHTHDSLYDEMQALGADCLTIPLFALEHRVETASGTSCDVPFVPEYVFSGIGKTARLMRENVDYTLRAGGVEFAVAPGAVVDFYSGCAWPERFNRDDLQERRRKTRTVNYWDSQYQLHSRPIHDVRLDPQRIKPYDVEPEVRSVNNETLMTLGGVRIVSASCRWDPSSGKLKSDSSVLCLTLQDEQGRRYWHRSEKLTGDIAEFDDSGKRITGGQVIQIADIVAQLHVPRIVIETNGAGTFAPTVLKAALKQRKLRCGVKGEPTAGNKNKRILDAIEGPLKSGTLWAHVSVLEGDAWDEMRDWNPAVADQPDDHLDALAAAITDTPERIGKAVVPDGGLNPPDGRRDDWRPAAGVHEVELEF